MCRFDRNVLVDLFSPKFICFFSLLNSFGIQIVKGGFVDWNEWRRRLGQLSNGNVARFIAFCFARTMNGCNMVHEIFGTSANGFAQWALV